MATTTSLPQPVALPPGQTPFGGLAYLRRFTVDEYHSLIELGILTPDDKVELLEGYLVLNMPRGPAHDFVIQALAKRLYRVLPPPWDLRNQCAVTLDDSEPEPDFAVVRGDETTFETRHPGPTEVGILIEIANSSLGRDREDKARIYAKANVPVYWVVNVVDRQVEVYTQPSGPTATPAYGSSTTYRPGDNIPIVLDGVTVQSLAAADFLPK
jgi:Uma2 family endonuclease